MFNTKCCSANVNRVAYVQMFNFYFYGKLSLKSIASYCNRKVDKILFFFMVEIRVNVFWRFSMPENETQKKAKLVSVVPTCQTINAVVTKMFQLIGFDIHMSTMMRHRHRKLYNLRATSSSNDSLKVSENGSKCISWTVDRETISCELFYYGKCEETTTIVDSHKL